MGIAHTTSNTDPEPTTYREDGFEQQAGEADAWSEAPRPRRPSAMVSVPTVRFELLYVFFVMSLERPSDVGYAALLAHPLESAPPMAVEPPLDFSQRLCMLVRCRSV